MKIIVGNWKLHPKSVKEVQALVLAFAKIRALYKVVLCPPAIFLPAAAASARASKAKFELGSQDIFWQASGPYTGQVSAPMLKQFNVKYAIIGHSERRNLGETDHEVNLKVKAALAAKITPIVCVGFGLRPEMNDEEVFVHIREQLALDLADVDPKKVIAAYEPVWALSSGDPHKTKKMPSPNHVERVAMFIRIKFKAGKVLYGGSSDADNDRAFLERQIDGLLVGGASVDQKEFAKMITTKI